MPIKKSISKDGADHKEFLSVLSHQLRSPLTTVKFLTEALLKKGDGLDAEARKKIQSMADANETALRIVADMLDISKFIAKEIKPVFEMCDLKDMIQSLVDMFRPVAAAKNQKLLFAVPEDLHMVKICNEYLLRACQNIIDNAVSYGDENSEISITLSENKTHDAYLVSVHDYGPVIPQDEISKIFQKFHRVPGIEKIKPVGTGLGLFIAKEAIELNGGKIWIESSAAKGTTVFFTVPFKAPRA